MDNLTIVIKIVSLITIIWILINSKNKVKIINHLKKWVLATNSDFLISISLQPDVVDHWFPNYEIY